MMHRAVAALLVLLLLLPAAQAASTGARAPITVEGTVNDVALAATNGRFAAAFTDSGSTTMGERDAPVWTLWNGDGSVRQAASADPDVCLENLVTPPEDCRTSATHIAVSADGSRIAVASDQSGTTDLVTLFRDAGDKLFGPVAVAGAVTDLAISADGSRVAVSARTAGPGDDPTDSADGFAQVYDSSGSGLMGSTGLRYDDPAVRVALSPDGQTLVVAAGDNHYYKGMSSMPTDYNHRISGTSVTDVDASGVGGWTIAGFANGFFGLYNGAITDPSPVEYQKKEAGSDASGLTAVAIRSDATAFVTGSSGGTLRYYRLDTTAQADQATLVASVTGLGAILNATFSADGRHLAVRSGADALRLYRATADGLQELWKDNRAGLDDAIAIDSRGEHVLAGAGSTVIVYDAIHKLTAILPSQTQDPGTSADYTVTYRNDGNRQEDVTLSASPPVGASVSPNPPSFSIAPGAQKAVIVTVTLPATRAPGTTTIPLTHSLSDGLDGSATSSLAITVPTKRDLRLVPDGATSLAATPGAVAVFHVTALNAGNVRETGTLKITGLPTGWTSGVEPETLDLAPGASTNVSVSLGPPANAPHLSQAIVRLERTGGPSLDLTATVGAGFRVRLTAPQGLLLEPGRSGLVNMTVRNEGNAPDTIVVRLGTLPSGWQGAFLSGLSEHRLENLAAGQEEVVQATLRPAEDSSTSVPIQVSVTAASLGDPSQRMTKAILITVEEPSTESESASETDGDGGGNGIPGVPPMVLVLTLAALAVGFRRRR
ncbi:MAG: hypothetical protein ACYC2H_05995 [Thermoplasmatota archaeon]